MDRKKFVNDILFIAIAVAALIYLVYIHIGISDNILTDYRRQQEEIEHLEMIRDNMEEDNRHLEYRKYLLENDKDLYYETLLREDYSITFEGETVYILDDHSEAENGS